MAHSSNGVSGSFQSYSGFTPSYNSTTSFYSYNSYNSWTNPSRTTTYSSSTSSDPPKLSRGALRGLKITFSTLATLIACLGFGIWVFFPANTEAGLGHSRLTKENWLLVREIEIKKNEGADGAYVYSFSKPPSLQDDAEVEYSYRNWLIGGYQAWALWMNKGSTMTIHYDVKTRNLGIIFAVLKGEANFQNWLVNPYDYGDSVRWSRIRGEGKVEVSFHEDDDYYFAFGAMENIPVEVNLRLVGSLKQYSTQGYESRCSLDSGSCKLKNPSFWLLTTPASTYYKADMWRFTAVYKAQWLTYVAFFATIAVVFSAVIVLIMNSCCEVEEEKKPKNNEKAPLIDPESQTEDTPKSSTDTRLCVVCMEAEKDSFFDPCGHSATCHSCGSRIKESPDGKGVCPICRENIKEVRKLFQS